MPRPDRLIACPSCACHVQASESRCPHCDATIRQADGSVQRTAAAILLGLSTAVAGCATETVAPVYGTSATGGSAGTTSVGGTTASGGATSTGGTGGGGIGGIGGTGGMGGTGGTGGTGGDTNQPVYGAPPMTGGAGGQ